MKEIVNIETATAEVNNWLDSRKVMPTKRERMQPTIDNLIEAVQYGMLVIGEGNVLRHNLAFPVLDSAGVPFASELTYKARISTDSVIRAISALKINIPDTQVMAYIAELTGQPYSIIAQLETTDMLIAKSIAVFFMS